MPFVDTVFDKPTGNAARGKLSIGKYNLFLQIPFDKPLGIDLGPEYVADCLPLFVPKADTSLVLSHSLFIIDCELCTR
jgi:hypothetical protein